MRFPFFRNRDSVKNGILISIRRTGDGFHPGLFIYINWREPAFSSVVCKQKVCLTTKRRTAKEMQVVGGPNSTDEGVNKINTRGKSRENCSSQFWPAKLYQRGNISYTQR